ncbi:MAG: hypothetical protein HQ481_22070 [Alphaproteobacteria bacterium]|jgi:hypothetical protein|nr:hypothetical protein [Alphaproteobacteria bacterium]
MPRKKLSALAASFQGRWRITEMDLCDAEALDLVEPAFLVINGAEGEMGFIAVQAWLDIRYDASASGPIAEFSWEGVDEGDQCSGRGRVAMGAAGRLVGHLYFHMGDDSAFVCEPG